MLSIVSTGALRGVCACLVRVEVDIARGLPGFELVGHAGGEVREARERVKVALKNAGMSIPAMHLTVNLSPADMLKEGTGFDLPIAVGILEAMEVLPKEASKGMLLMGELGLGGEVKRVRGTLPIVREAYRQGIRRCIVPLENAGEGEVVSGMEIIGVQSMEQLIQYLKEPEEKRHLLPPFSMPKQQRAEEKEPGQQKMRPSNLRGLRHEEKEPDFSDIMGQETVKRGAEIAAAGFHHMLIVGPPGTGKTMIGRRLPGILPPMTGEESLEVSDIYSAQGLLDASHTLITKRPFVHPHHTVSAPALVGGGRIPRPGAVSMAHRGVLFLDELPEFSRRTLDALRQPLEEKGVDISRTWGSLHFPADFMLVCAMNPCPCGYYPDRNRCTCTENAVHNYLNHVSGPILDRMDICVEAPYIDVRNMNKGRGGETSARIRERVMKARQRQEKRFMGTGYRFNSEIAPGDMKRYCPLGTGEEELLYRIFEQTQMSIRAYHKILKVARTIADIEGSGRIRKEDISEAASYRAADMKYWRGREEK